MVHRLTIEQLERKTVADETTKAKAAWLAKEQQCLVHPLTGIISSSDDSVGTALRRQCLHGWVQSHRDRKRKGLARKW